MIRCCDRDLGIDRDGSAGLRCRLTVDSYLAGEDERARAFARRDQSTIDEQRIQSNSVL